MDDCTQIPCLGGKTRNYNRLQTARIVPCAETTPRYPHVFHPHPPDAEPVPDHPDERGFSWPAVQLWPAAEQHGADLQLPGRGRGGAAAAVARRADDGPAGTTHHRRHERPHRIALGAAYAVLLHWRSAVLAVPDRHALQLGTVDGCQPAVDPGCGQQRDDGALPGLRQRPASPAPATRRFPDAKRLHGAGADAVVHGAHAARVVRHEQGRGRRQPHPADHHGRFHDRCLPVIGHHCLVDVAGSGVAAHAGTTAADPGPEARLWRHAARDLGRHRGHAQDHAAVGADEAVPVVRDDLLLAVRGLCHRPLAVRLLRPHDDGLS